MTSRSFSSHVSALSAATLVGAALLLSGCGKRTNETAATPAPKSQSKLETADERVSYGVGYNMGSNMVRQPGLQVDRDALIAGLQDGLSNAKPQVEENDIRAAFSMVQERATAASAKEGEANRAAASAHLEKNRTKPGVTVTSSGLQYEVLKSGNGPKPKPTDRVEVHYHGTLLDGTVFDSSVQRGQTVEFPVTGVIPGWIEALQLMSVGDKWRLTIPPDLAYGPRATGKIPPNSALVFEVELIAIK
jgi:FKBP-type peptidyl-prolyl cis-trans isomerase FklB